MFTKPSAPTPVESAVLCLCDRANEAEYGCFLGEDFHEYLTEMSLSGTWGDELTLVGDDLNQVLEWRSLCAALSDGPQKHK